MSRIIDKLYKNEYNKIKQILRAKGAKPGHYYVWDDETLCYS